MARSTVWKAITETLEAEISEGLYRVGDKLPTEAALAGRFGVNRHTVRRALSDMAERGVVRSRRGSGVFVETEATEYPIGRRVRFHRNIRATGRLPQKQVLRLERRPGSAVETKALDLAAGEEVLVYEGLSLSDGLAIALFISVFPITRLPQMEASLSEVTSVTEALKRSGVPDYTRRETRLTAEVATPTQALHLGLRQGAALLRSEGVNVDAAGVPVEHGTTWFSGERVAITITPEDL